jgi:hypothetical protein
LLIVLFFICISVLCCHQAQDEGVTSKKKNKAKLRKKQADKVLAGNIVRQAMLGNVQEVMAAEGAGDNNEGSDNDSDHDAMPKPPLTEDEKAYVAQCATHSINPDGEPLSVPKKKKKRSYAKSKGTP